jgi:molybdate transport system permease protein
MDLKPLYKKAFAHISGNGHMLIFAGVFIASVVFFCALFAGLVIYAADGEWRKVFANPEFRFAAGFTFFTGIAATAAASAAGLACAAFLSRRSFRGKIFFDTILDAPLVMPPLVSGIALLIFLGPLVGHRLSSIGINAVFTPLGAVIAQAFIAFPFALKMFRESFDAVDIRYENIARIMGCSPMKTFFHVTLPMARRGLLSGIAMTWARTVGEFGATAMLAGVTRMKTETLSAAIFLNISIGEMQFALVISVMLLCSSMTVLIFFKWVSTRVPEGGEQ